MGKLGDLPFWHVVRQENMVKYEMCRVEQIGKELKSNISSWSNTMDNDWLIAMCSLYRCFPHIYQAKQYIPAEHGITIALQSEQIYGYFVWLL